MQLKREKIEKKKKSSGEYNNENNTAITHLF